MATTTTPYPKVSNSNTTDGNGTSTDAEELPIEIVIIFEVVLFFILLSCCFCICCCIKRGFRGERGNFYARQVPIIGWFFSPPKRRRQPNYASPGADPGFQPAYMTPGL